MEKISRRKFIGHAAGTTAAIALTPAWLNANPTAAALQFSQVATVDLALRTAEPLEVFVE